MIFLESRYADGTIFKANDARKGTYPLTVFRSFPTDSQAFFYYEWKYGDRLDLLSNQFLGDPEFWWQIMDFNPQIMDPCDISPGTLLRIPRV